MLPRADLLTPNRGSTYYAHLGRMVKARVGPSGVMSEVRYISQLGLGLPIVTALRKATPKAFASDLRAGTPSAVRTCSIRSAHSCVVDPRSGLQFAPRVSQSSLPALA